MLEAKVIDRGRGPEIAGSRITFYDVLDHNKEGWPAREIAWLFHLSTEQVEAAIRYIEEHKDEVMVAYERILARHALGNPPELQAKLDAGREQFLAIVRERQRAKAQEKPDAGDSRGHQCGRDRGESSFALALRHLARVMDCPRPLCPGSPDVGSPPRRTRFNDLENLSARATRPDHRVPQ
jgi:uncharacterized protein (DUF433 family)